MSLAVELSSHIPLEALSSSYKEYGRVHVPNFLTENSAEDIHRWLIDFTGWNLVFNSGERHVDIYAEQLTLMTESQIQEAQKIAYSGAANGFQYLFKNYPIYDAYHEGICPTPLNNLFEFLNSNAVLDVAKKITGHSDIAFADAQLTKFEAGHFLTTHDDNIDGKDRRAAYVLNLTPNWRADWGGLLQFFDENGHIDGGFTPSFNALNIFSVPKPHAVSQVTPFAGGSRYSITGWFRAGKDPKA